MDGLYARDPRDGPADLIPEVHEITPEIERSAGAAATGRARGGMASKIAMPSVSLKISISFLLTNSKTPTRYNSRSFRN